MLMVFDHIIVDIADFFGKAWYAAKGGEILYNVWQSAVAFNNSQFHETAQHIVVWIFCLVCGISCYFSRSNLKRGLIVAICAALVTAVTRAVGAPVRFGILHMFAVAILAFWCIDTLCRHKKLRTATACLVIGIAIICIDSALSQMYITRGRHVFTDNSDWYFLGEWMLGDTFYSSDYYPIFPSAGYMLIGAFVGYVLYNKRRTLLPRIGKYGWHAPFDIWGRLALYVYVLHQLVIGAVLALISYFFLTPGDFVII
ncbi:MAG: DUF1624 domain-containing protein [Clostridia bacterium]|nr:DUF1624 domain-containing protein [Clostridia bacterium]